MGRAQWAIYWDIPMGLFASVTPGYLVVMVGFRSPDAPGTPHGVLIALTHRCYNTQSPASL
jgi:hypothetical protein